MKKVIEFCFEYSLFLIAGVLVALLCVNGGLLGTYNQLIFTPFLWGSISVHFIVNEIFMVFFFGIATKEIVASCLKGGALNPLSSAINPLLATVGGVLGPICIYFLYIYFTGEVAIARGWAIPTATDIALAWLVARFIWPKGHPAISFLLLLAVADDGIGLVIIAGFYPDPVHPVQIQFLALVVLGMLISWLFSRRGANFWPTIIVGGTLSWWGLHLSHLHPALALVCIVPFLQKEALEKFEHTFKKGVDVGLFGFGLANSNVVIGDSGPATWAVLSSYLLGKPIGICSFSYLGTKLGAELPKGMSFKDLIVASFVAGIGLTVSLFVSGVAFANNIVVQGAAKIGALLSVLAGGFAVFLAKVLGIKKSN